MKAYSLIPDLKSVSTYDNIFLHSSATTNKKVNFCQFLIVLTKVSLLSNPSLDPLESLTTYLTSKVLTKPEDTSVNEFDLYKTEYETSIVQGLMNKNLPLFSSIFNSYSTTLKQSQKILTLK